jgi:hypothetical protein
MSVCILRQDGEVGLHRNMPAGPATFLKAIAPYRDDIVVAVACLFTWYWLADLCAQAGLSFVLGHALSMKALQGGKATNEKIDSPKIAVWLRGGRLPQAYVYPAALRAPRDLLRRRMPLRRQRAARLAHLQNTHSQDKLPQLGQKMASKANRNGVAERLTDPAVQKSLAGVLALLGHDDPLRRDVALSVLQTAKPHTANTLYLRRPVPGLGEILRLVLL